MIRTTVTLVAALATGQILAQTQSPPAPDGIAPATPVASAPPAAAPSPAACHGLCAGTVVELEITDRLNSAERKRGDRFGLRLVSGLVVDGVELVPAGATGVGEVVHASAARGGGKPGELLLAGRYLEFQGRQLPLRGLKLGVAGKSNAELALAVSFAAGPFAMFIRGREIEIPAGTPVHAKLAQDVSFDAPMPALPSAVPFHQE